MSADRGCDRDAVIAQAEQQGMEADIPPRRNRKEPRDYDRALYNLRHLLENALRTFNQWREVVTRYAKTEASLSAICKNASNSNGDKIILTRLYQHLGIETCTSMWTSRIRRELRLA